jgi:hypothetical protein
MAHYFKLLPLFVKNNNKKWKQILLINKILILLKIIYIETKIYNFIKPILLINKINMIKTKSILHYLFKIKLNY